MGHAATGELARTRKWDDVVALVVLGAGVRQITMQTVEAMEDHLLQAARHKGVVESVWLLMRIPIAAKSDDFARSLRECGMDVPEHPALFDVTSGVSDAIERRMMQGASRSDLGLLAKTASVETLTSLLGSQIPDIFGGTAPEIQLACARLGTVKQFGACAKDFFARFVRKGLDSFLSKCIHKSLGEAESRTLHQNRIFNEALDLHCRQAAVIVENYSGEWFSKRNWETKGDLTRSDVQKFTGYAMKKLVSELKKGVRSHAV